MVTTDTREQQPPLAVLEDLTYLRDVLTLQPPTQHTAVLAQAAEAREVATLRRATDRILDQWGVDSADRETAVLIVSELAGNAVRYGRAELTLHLNQTGRTLLLEVTDSGAVQDSVPLHLEEEEHGRGLDLVTCLAQNVERSTSPYGTCVRAECRLGAPA